jgi:putative acetyltransferase
MSTMSNATTRRATPTDAARIADAHRDSIRSIGPAFYPPRVVAAWQDGLGPDLYASAMKRGEVFFIAEHRAGDGTEVLGFASDYAIEGARYGVSAYVRGRAARQGIGSALLRLAEADAMHNGATVISIEASLAAVKFYRANGYVEIGRGHSQLTSGQPIACVFMEKDLQKA